MHQGRFPLATSNNQLRALRGRLSTLGLHVILSVRSKVIPKVPSSCVIRDSCYGFLFRGFALFAPDVPWFAVRLSQLDFDALQFQYLRSQLDNPPVQSLLTPRNMPEETAPVDSVPQFGFKKRSKPKANFRKKPATPPPASDSGSDFSSDDDGEGRRIKRRRKNVAVTASSTANPTRRAPDVPESAAPAPLTSSNDATKQSNWYDEEDLSAKNLLGSTRVKPQTSTSGPDGTYKGASNYTSFIQKNPDAPKQFGPVKASTNVRTVTTMDFAPDVCKDWKQTGFCVSLLSQ